jgi:UDP-N-acetylglucosamine 3-dehydrogenase
MVGSNSTGALTVGIIGCGDVARRVHLPQLEAAGAAVIRFASHKLDDAQAAADAARHDAMATDDWRMLVASPHIRAVDICTPNHLHAEMAMAALEAGKHVLVEAPMALDLRDADALLKTAARKGLLLVPAHSVRFIAPYAAVIAACQGGKVGRIERARIEFGHPGPDRLRPHAPWYLERSKAGGGAMIDLGPTMVDLLRAAIGSEVASVAARLSGERGEVEARAEARLRFENGAVADLVASWEGPANLVEIEGTEGVIRLDASGVRLIVDGTESRLRPPEQLPTGIEASFVDSVTHDRIPPVKALDGRAAVAVVTAAYESAAAGAPVEVTRPTW